MGLHSDQELARRVNSVLTDGWQEEGRLRAGAIDLPGARAMASGIAHPQWNSADIESAEVDLHALRAWYAARRVPWGVRVPAGINVHLDHFVMHQPAMGCTRGWFRPAGAGDGEVTLASPVDLDSYVRIDACAFGEDPRFTRQWVGPAFGASGWRHYLARVDDEPAGVAYAKRTDDRGGPGLSVWGVAVVEEFRRRGIATQLVSRALADGFHDGAEVAALNPNEVSRSVYLRLGFRDVSGRDVYIDKM